MKIDYAIEYEGRYVAFDGASGADGYRYVDGTATALRFDRANDVVTFMEVGGPGWVQKMTKKGLLHVRVLHDGVPQGILAREMKATP